MMSEKSSVRYRKILKKYRFFGTEGTVLCLRVFNFAYTHLSYKTCVERYDMVSTG
jgi:hypothetical protein